MDQRSQDYFRQREHAEQVAARSSPNAAARRAHEAMARGYAELLRKS